MKFIFSAVAVLLLMMQALAQQVRFTDGDVVRDIPFQIASNLIIVEASVGSAPKGFFILDTGAESTVVDSKYAASAGLTTSGRTVGTGSAGTAVAGVLKGVRLTLAGLEANDLTVYGLPLDELSVGFGMKIEGILGNDVIGKTIAEIDYTERKLTLYSPAAFHPSPQAEILPLTIEGGLPFVRVGIIVASKTIDSKMEIDTGSTGAVLFNGPFVRKNHLVTLVRPSIASRTGGVGGSAASRVGRLNGIRFGHAMITQPLAVLYAGTKGDNASNKYDGLLGGAIFRRFKMTVDIPGRRLLLEPTDRVNDPFETDMSGIELVGDGDDLSKILIDEVKPASVAAKAGVRGGEHIRSIDGTPASELGMDAIRTMFRTAGEYSIELARGRRVFTVHLVLKRVI